MVKKFEQEIRSRNEVGQSEVVSQFDVEADEVGQSQVCQSVRRRGSAMIRKRGAEKCRTIAYLKENGQFEEAGQFDAVGLSTMCKAIEQDSTTQHDRNQFGREPQLTVALLGSAHSFLLGSAHSCITWVRSQFSTWISSQVYYLGHPPATVLWFHFLNQRRNQLLPQGLSRLCRAP